MWLYFNKDGQLLEALIHGGRARSGTTNFKIFAYFDNVDTSLYNLATIQLTKPDLEKTEYPALPMGNGTIRKQFELGEHEHSMCFKDGEYYTGFEFDFDNIDDDEDVAVLLDTPGLWEAVITLIGSNRVLNVQGLATFLVENGVVYEHGYEVSEEMIINQLYTLIATKLSARDSILRVDPDITIIDVDTHELGQVFYEINSDKSINRLSRIVEESGTRRLDPLYDFNAYYTKTYIDNLEAALRGFTTDKVGDEALARSNADNALSDRIDAKSTVSGTVVNDKWKTLTINGETHNLGGGGGATYTAGNGIEIENNQISIDDTVVATKTDLQTLATKTELQTYATSNDNRVGAVEDNVSNLTTRVRNAEDDIDILEVRVGSAESDIDIIEGKIPPQASSSNKLADKDFVNSSIATSRATFRGTYNIVTDLGLTTSATHEQIASAIATKLASLSIVPDDNDYCYVAYPDATVSTQYTQFDEYKFNGTIWEYEFTLNNSSFTAEQWAAINSGITATILATLAQTSLIAPAYDNTATYSVGSKCVYNGKLYTCSTAITQAEDFDSSKWTEISVSSGFVDLDSYQTMVKKTFNPEIAITNGTTTFGLFVDQYNEFGIKQGSNNFFKIISGNIWTRSHFSQSNASYDLGISYNKWRDLYLSRQINRNSNGYGLTLPDTTNFTADRTIATTDEIAPTYSSSSTYGYGDLVLYNGQLYRCKTTISTAEAWDSSHWTLVNVPLAPLDQAFNVINASDITKNTLTQAQFDLITNGKPTLIKGTILGIHNGIFFPYNNEATGPKTNIIVGTGEYSGIVIGKWTVSSSKVLSISGATDQAIFLRSIYDINGKTIPVYPTTNTSRQYLSIAANGGGLSYEYIEETKTQSTGGATSIQLKTWVGTQAQYDSILTKDANTQYIII